MVSQVNHHQFQKGSDPICYLEEVKYVCCKLRLFSTCQAPLSLGFFRQEYWSELQIPSPGNLPNPGIEPASLASPALAGRLFTHWAIEEASVNNRQCIKEQRHHFADKGPYSQSYSFSSSHIRMWELDHKEGWVVTKTSSLSDVSRVTGRLTWSWTGQKVHLGFSVTVYGKT